MRNILTTRYGINTGGYTSHGPYATTSSSVSTQGLPTELEILKKHDLQTKNVKNFSLNVRYGEKPTIDITYIIKL